MFFVSAQAAGVAGALALVQALVMRASSARPDEVVLLVRRNGCAVAAAGVTLLASAIALPGQGPAVVLLAGPVVMCVASGAVLRSRALARRLPRAGVTAVRSPLDDAARLVGVQFPSVALARVLFVTTCLAAMSAFVWDLGEDASVASAVVIGGVEAAAVVGCFVLLGRTLGLRER